MEYFSTLSQKILSDTVLIQIGGFLIAIAFIIFVRSRTGSSFAIWDIGWRRFAGKEGFTNPELENFFQKTKVAERFRFIYRLNVGTSVRVERLMKFLEKYDISIQEIRKVTRWLDINAPSNGKDSGLVIDDIPNREIHISEAILVGAIIAFFALNILMAPSYTVLETKETRIHFWTNGEDLSRQLFGKYIGLSECAQGPEKIQKAMSFSAEESAAICTAHSDGEFTRFVRNSVWQQRIVFGVPYLISCVIGFWQASKLDRMFFARRLKARIEQ